VESAEVIAKSMPFVLVPPDLRNFFAAKVS